MGDRRDDIAAGTAGSLLLNVAALGLNFLVSLLLARLLGAKGYGAFAYAVAWASLLGGLSVLGLTPLLVRNVATYQARAEWGLIRGILRRADQAVLGASLALVAVAAGGGWFLIGPSEPVLLHAYWIGLLLLPLTALSSLRQAAMQALRRVVLGRVPEMLVMPLAFAALVLAAWLAQGGRVSAPQAVGLYAAAAALAFALGARLLRVTLPGEVRAVATAASRTLSQVLLVWLLWRRLRLYSPAVGLGRRAGEAMAR